MGATPGIPNIQPATGGTAQPQGVLDSASILALAGMAPTAPPPQTISGMGSAAVNPNGMRVNPAQQLPTNQQPMQNNSNEVNRAHRSNTFSTITNIVNKYGEKRQQEKADSLKTDISRVLQAQEQIGKAQQVLQSDPNNANAKSVLQKNKTILDGVMGDPKKQKALSKAFDISFTDPTKNKTPEVQAMQQAMADHKKNSAQGLTNNTPEEAALHSLLNPGSGKDRSSNELTRLPASNELTRLNNAPNPNQPVRASNAAPQAQAAQPPTKAQAQDSGARSSTPYADKFLAQQSPTIEENPQYAAWLKANEQNKKLLMQYALPHILQGEYQKQVESQKQDGANGRAFQAQVGKLTTEIMKEYSAARIQDSRNHAALDRVRVQQSGAMQRTMARINATEGVANAPGIKNTALAQAMKIKNIAFMTKSIDDTTKNITTAEAQIAAYRAQYAKTQMPPEVADRVETLNAAVKGDKIFLDQIQDQRRKASDAAYGAPDKEYRKDELHPEPTPAAKGEGKGEYDVVTNLRKLLGGSDAGNGTVSKPATEVVGSGQSDNPGYSDPDAYDTDSDQEESDSN